MQKQMMLNMNYIKNKIKGAWDWSKRVVKKTWQFVGGILIGTVMASQLVPMGSPPVVLPPIDTEPTNGRLYISAVPNYDNIQHESLRRVIDWRYTQAHDILSEAYYEQKAFVWEGTDYGVLTKEKFDKTQALIWAKYEILFHEENMKQEAKDRIPLAEYEEIRECDIDTETCTVVGKTSEKALEKINQFKNESVPDINI